jgi:predicted DNA-binding antitoxin AbrB/MazE fold protein
MITQVEATFANGVLTPDTPLQLAEQTRVRLTVEPVPDTTEEALPTAALRAWIKQNPLDFGGIKYSREEIHERD